MNAGLVSVGEFSGGISGDVGDSETMPELSVLFCMMVVTRLLFTSNVKAKVMATGARPRKLIMVIWIWLW